MKGQDAVCQSKFARLGKIAKRMELHAMLRIGEWRVQPASSEISCKEEIVRLEVRGMRLLLCLAEHAGEVVSIDDLITNVWAGVNVSQDSVYQAITSLRRVLGDDFKQPAYIETVPRLGYRLVARVSSTETSRPLSRTKISLMLGVTICLALFVVFGLGLHREIQKGSSAFASSRPQRSIAVLPF